VATALLPEKRESVTRFGARVRSSRSSTRGDKSYPARASCENRDRSWFDVRGFDCQFFVVTARRWIDRYVLQRRDRNRCNVGRIRDFFTAQARQAETRPPRSFRVRNKYNGDRSRFSRVRPRGSNSQLHQSQLLLRYSHPPPNSTPTRLVTLPLTFTIIIR